MGAIRLVIALCSEGAPARPALAIVLVVGLAVLFLGVPGFALLTARPEARGALVVEGAVAVAIGFIALKLVLSGGDQAIAIGVIAAVVGIVLGIVVGLLDLENEIGDFWRLVVVGAAGTTAPTAGAAGLFFAALLGAGGCPFD